MFYLLQIVCMLIILLTGKELHKQLIEDIEMLDSLVSAPDLQRIQVVLK